MFERARFMVTFAGAYRRSRRNGADHEAALRAATEDAFGGRRTELPDAVAELWRDPAADCTLPGAAWFGDGSLVITEAHLGLLKQSRLGWDGAERGAPMLDPDRPYGRADLLAQARALRHGTLAPGRYPPTNVAPAEVHGALRGYGELSFDDLGLDADGQVVVTEHHLKLLRAIEIRWPSTYDCADRLAAGEYPAAAADAKRPYGDFTFIEVDMARILGDLPPAPGPRPHRGADGNPGRRVAGHPRGTGQTPDADDLPADTPLLRLPACLTKPRPRTTPSARTLLRKTKPTR